MARKRQIPIEEPQTESSTDKEEEESSSEEEDEETPPPKPSSSLPKKPQSHSSSSESDESYPNGTKLIEETPNTTIPISKPVTKRPIQNDEDQKHPKKAKTELGKKQLILRLWSEDDEIALLDGMIQYSKKEGEDPTTDLNVFLDFIKNSLQCDVTKSQLSDKIRRLKNKYLNRAGKDKDPTFSKQHDKKSFDLSKKIWGSASMFNEKATLPSPKKKREIVGSESEMVLSENNMEDYVLEAGLELIDGRNRVKLEKKWRKLHLAQLELYVERSELIVEQAKLILESAKLSNN